jgi:hypothetical protein
MIGENKIKSSFKNEIMFWKEKCFANVEADPRVLEIPHVFGLNQGLWVQI